VSSDSIIILYPGAKPVENLDRLSTGFWPTGEPRGVTLHYTASGNLSSAIDTCYASGLGYHLIIDRDGLIHQLSRLDRRVNHAGPAHWRAFSPNQEHLAVALVGWGKLIAHAGGFQSWCGTNIRMLEVVQRFDWQGISANWHAATCAQESMLLDILRWTVKTFNIDPMDICGHDECAIPVGRKEDPGGMLKWPTRQLRSLAKL
jgi:N-acetyl-anhydromuramyl-L-alanine amidase AmpD